MEKRLQITLTAARVNAGFSLDEVAEKMQKSKSTIINWEKGRTKFQNLMIFVIYIELQRIILFCLALYKK